MYELNDTIVAVSSATSDKRVIIRITGAEAVEQVNHSFRPQVQQGQAGIIDGSLSVDNNFEIDATVYLFASGHSYTGEALVEIHIWSNASVTEAVINNFLGNKARMAAPGEFTARAYLNGRMDLAQAEAVNKVVTCGNRLQLAAGQKLLAGRLSETTSTVAAKLIDCLSMLEAGMDFSEEEIEFISAKDAVRRLECAKSELEQLLSGSISFEAVLDLPAVGIAGAVNTGKSSLLNTLVERERSIVSSRQKTTRDILTGILELQHNRCVLFDCAGLITQTHSQIDELAQEAAVEALNSADVVLICVDVTKKGLAQDTAIQDLIKPKAIVAVATKTDLLDKDKLAEQLARLERVFNLVFLPVSSKNPDRIEQLRKLIDAKLVKQAGPADAQKTTVAITARYKQSFTEAIENINQAITELKQNNNEVATMMIRGAYQALSNIEAGHIDEKILDSIFSEFCIGK